MHCKIELMSSRARSDTLNVETFKKTKEMILYVQIVGSRPLWDLRAIVKK